MVREYWIATCIDYARGRVPDINWTRLKQRQFRYNAEERATPEPGAWRAEQDLNDVLSVVEYSAGREAAQVLEECGRQVGGAARTKFLGSTLSSMTPDLLCDKLPDVWAIDHRASDSAQISVIHGAGETCCQVSIRDTSLLKFLPVITGWLQFVFEETRAQNVRVATGRWVRGDTPVQEASFQVSWT